MVNYFNRFNRYKPLKGIGFALFNTKRNAWLSFDLQAKRVDFYTLADGFVVGFGYEFALGDKPRMVDIYRILNNLYNGLFDGATD